MTPEAYEALLNELREVIAEVEAEMAERIEREHAEEPSPHEAG